MEDCADLIDNDKTPPTAPTASARVQPPPAATWCRAIHGLNSTKQNIDTRGERSWARLIDAIRRWTTGSEDRIHWAELIPALALAGCGLTLLALRIRKVPIDPDELGHLHSAWMWLQGLAPYADFFEHHPPLYWLLLKPIVSLGSPNDLAGLVADARALNVVVALLTCVFTYHAVSQVSASKRAGLAAVAAWALFCPLSNRMIHARPDQLMLLLLVIGTYLSVRGSALVRGEHKPEPAFSLGGGLAMGLALWILPKAVFWVALLSACFVIAPLYLKTRRTSTTYRALVFYFVGIATMSTVMFAWILAASDWSAFWHDNLHRNSSGVGRLVQNGTLLGPMRRPLNWAMPPAVAAGIGAVLLLVKRRPMRLVTVAAGTLSGLLLIALALARWHHYHFPFIWWLTLLTGFAFAAVTARMNGALRVIVALALVAPVPISLYNGRQETKHRGLEASLRRYQTILDRAKPDDTMIALSHRNPVFIRNAAPDLWMTRMLDRNDTRDQRFVEAILKLRPRFVFDAPFRPLHNRQAFKRFYTRAGGNVFVRSDDPLQRRRDGPSRRRKGDRARRRRAPLFPRADAR